MASAVWPSQEISRVLGEGLAPRAAAMVVQCPLTPSFLVGRTVLFPFVLFSHHFWYGRVVVGIGEKRHFRLSPCCRCDTITVAISSLSPLSTSRPLDPPRPSLRLARRQPPIPTPARLVLREELTFPSPSPPSPPRPNLGSSHLSRRQTDPNVPRSIRRLSAPQLELSRALPLRRRDRSDKADTFNFDHHHHRYRQQAQSRRAPVMPTRRSPRIACSS